MDAGVNLARRRTQAERREASDQRLLLAAAELIATEGFGAASFDRLGKVSGYSRGLASQKFGSKDGLICAVVNFLATRVFDAAEVELAGTQSGATKIVAYCESVLTQFEQDHLSRAYFIMLTAAVAHRMPVQSVFMAAHDQVRDRLRELILAGQGDGSIDGGVDAYGVAMTIGSLALGIGTQMLLDATLDARAVRAAALRSIARALAPDHAP